jgi:hypothetical protein
MAGVPRKTSIMYMIFVFLAVLLVLGLVFPIREGFTAIMGGIKARGETCGQNSECESQFCHTAVCT